MSNRLFLLLKKAISGVLVASWSFIWNKVVAQYVIPLLVVILSIKFYIIPTFIDFVENLTAKTEPRDKITRRADPVDKKVSERGRVISEEKVKSNLRGWMSDEELKRLISEDLKVNESKYRDEIEAVLYKLEVKSDEDIWDHALEKTPWFVKQFYSKRADDSYIKEMMRQYLLPSENVMERYQRIVIRDSVMAIEQIINKIASAQLEKIKIENSQTELPFSEDELLNLLRQLLPSADEIIQSIYRGLEIDGQNSLYQNKYLESYKTFELENPGLSISMKSFTILTTVLITSNPVILSAVVLTTVASEILRNDFKGERLEYETILLKNINITRRKYHEQIEYFMWTLFNGVVGYIKDEDFVVTWKKR